MELDMKAVNCEKPSFKQTQTSLQFDPTNEYLS